MNKIADSKLQSKSKKFEEIDKIKARFIEAMDDDFNTPQGLAAIFDLVNLTNKQINNADFVIVAKDTLNELLGILGISLFAAPASGLDDKNIEAKIAERNRLKSEKKYSEADGIRKELETQGIILEDTKSGTAWRRKL